MKKENGDMLKQARECFFELEMLLLFLKDADGHMNREYSDVLVLSLAKQMHKVHSRGLSLVTEVIEEELGEM